MVVDREAVHPLPRQERQRRIVQIREELRDNHECEHPGRFERIFGGGRRGLDAKCVRLGMEIHSTTSSLSCENMRGLSTESREIKTH